jgi:hypothetical protein
LVKGFREKVFYQENTAGRQFTPETWLSIHVSKALRGFQRKVCLIDELGRIFSLLKL